MLAIVVVVNNKYTEKCMERFKFFTPVECNVPTSIPLDRHPQ
jgi:hypothetical protein